MVVIPTLITHINLYGTELISAGPPIYESDTEFWKVNKFFFE